MNISSKQLAFLKKEFGLEASDIEKFDVEQWQKIREKCFDIETEEAFLANGGDGPLSERGNIAVNLADLKFDKLKGTNK